MGTAPLTVVYPQRGRSARLRNHVADPMRAIADASRLLSQVEATVRTIVPVAPRTQALKAIAEAQDALGAALRRLAGG